MTRIDRYRTWRNILTADVRHERQQGVRCRARREISSHGYFLFEEKIKGRVTRKK
jgi:hypothetical protein